MRAAPAAPIWRAANVQADTVRTPVGGQNADSGHDDPLAAALAEPASPSFRHVLTVGGVLSIEEVGVRAALARRPITDAPWSFPVKIDASALLGGNGDGGFGSILALGGGVHAARRLGRSTIYLQPGVQLTGGFESAYQANGPFLGGRLSLDLIRYPTRGGFVAGVGVYEGRRLGPGIQNVRETGVSVMLGAQF